MYRYGMYPLVPTLPEDTRHFDRMMVDCEADLQYSIL